MHPHVPLAARSPTLADLAWAAGFLEGEGNFASQRNSERVIAVQMSEEPLKWLQVLFGGTVGYHNKSGAFKWAVYGVRARGVMITLYALLSQRRREQVRRALRCVD